MADFTNASFIKICGVTNVHDARVVIASGADALGVILAQSSRRVSREDARTIFESSEGEILRTLVFRDNSDEYIIESVRRIDADVVQVHGSLGAPLVDALHERGLRVIKALSITDGEFLTFDDGSVDAVLVDGPFPGSGRTHSWDAMARRSFKRPVIIAGGLNADNVNETIEVVRPWGVDCASGVEESAGIKDPTLVSRFITNARQGLNRRKV